MVGSLFVSSAEISRYLEASFQEIYSIASAEYEDLLVKTATISVTAGQSIVTLPPQIDNITPYSADIKKLRGVRIKDDDFLSPLSLREIQNQTRANRRGKPTNYWFYGDFTNNSGAFSIQLLPAADTSYQLVLYYQPLITLEGTTGIPGGSSAPLVAWDEYIVLSSAIKCKDKEESSVSVLIAEKQALLAAMRASWTPVDVSEAQRVVPLASGRMRTLRAYDYQGPDDDY
jgi:hypothetical protein